MRSSFAVFALAHFLTLRLARCNCCSKVEVIDNGTAVRKRFSYDPPVDATECSPDQCHLNPWSGTVLCPVEIIR